MMSKKLLPTLISLPKVSLSKRQRFILTAVVLAIGLLAIQVANVSWRYQAIGGLAILTYFLSAWSLSEGLTGVEWFTVLILPVLFTTSVGLFYFLLPTRWVARLPVAVLFGVGMYVLLLTENIFSVAAIRTIQLLRAAHAAGFLLALVTAFFLYDTALSFRLSFWFNFLVVGLVSLPLFLSSLWSVDLEEKISLKIWLYSFSLSLILAEMAMAFSFWPVTITSGSLFLVTAMYILLGLSQHRLSGRLFKRTVIEYLGVGAAVLFIMLLTTHWGG